MRAAVFTHVLHYFRKDSYEAYPPYVREMDLWLEHFSEVEIVAPLSYKSSDIRGQRYKHPKLTFSSVPEIKFLSFRSGFESVFKIPLICYRISKAMLRADHVQLRCPGNMGLLASIIQIFFPRKSKTAKYAGNWDPAAVRPLSYNLQRWILGNTSLTRRMKVLVYGRWPGQSKNITSFITATFSEKDRARVPEKKFVSPFVFLFAGTLVKGKGVFSAIEMIKDLKRRGVQVSLVICGDGPEREKLENNSKEEVRKEILKFRGNLSLKELKEEYESAHFLILPSRTEGWPKVIAEAMFFGCIPIATPVSCVPWMLGEGDRGLLFSFGSEEAEKKNALERLTELLKEARRMQDLSSAAKQWSQQYTLERFALEIEKILKQKIPKKLVRERIWE